MIEIELKARISAEEAHAVEERLLELCDGQRETIDKRDTYLRLSPHPAHENGASATDRDKTLSDTHDTAATPRHIRLRRTGVGICVCTVKARAINAVGVERNREAECAVESYDKAYAALRLFGFVVDIEKRKIGHAYRYRKLLIEVVEIAGLAGRFVELERLLTEENASPTATRDEATLLLWETLAILHIPRTCVEPRRYIDLLRNLTAEG